MGLIGAAVYQGGRSTSAVPAVEPAQRAPGSRARRAFGSQPLDSRLAVVRCVALLGRPDLLARLGLVHRDRLRRLGRSRSAALRIRTSSRSSAVATALLQPREQLRRVVLALPRPERLEQVLVGRLDLLGLGDRVEDRLAAQRPLGVLLGVVDQLVAVLALHLRVRLGSMPRAGAGARSAPTSRWPARGRSREGSRASRWRRRRRPPRRGTRPRRGARMPRRSRADVVAQLVERVEVRGVGGEVVVELGQVLLPDLLDRRPRTLAVLPASSSGWWSSGKLTSTVRSSPGGAPPSAASNSGSRPSEPSSIRKSFDSGPRRLAVDLPAKSISTASPAAAGRSTGARPPKPSRRRSISASIASRGDLELGLADLEPLVVAELGLRADADLDRELERLALGGRLAHVELRVADRGDAAVEQRPLVPLRQRPRAAPGRPRRRGRPAGARSAAEPCPCESPASSSRRRARGRAVDALLDASAATATSILTLDSGSSVTSVFMRRGA